MLFVWPNRPEGAMFLSPIDQNQEFRTDTWRILNESHIELHWLSWQHIREHLEELIVTNDGTRPEQELRSQLGKSDQKEYQQIMLARRFFHTSVHEWPDGVKLLYDNVCDGKREQFKTAFVRRNATCFECPNFAHRVARKKVPYQLGDCDVYCFCCVMRDVGVFVIWKIPEAALLPRTKTSIVLHVLGKHGENADLHQRIFGKMPRWTKSSSDRMTAAYVSVFDI